MTQDTNNTSVTAKIPPNHKKRVITSLLLFSFVGSAMFSNGGFDLPYLLVGLLILVSAVALWEFYGFFKTGLMRIVLSGLGIVLGSGIIYASMENSPWWILGILSFAFFISSLSFLFTYGCKDQTQTPQLHYILLIGIVYIPVTLQIALHLNFFEQAIVLSATFVSDIAAYYAGCLWGDKKIWATVSPKKTWVGSIAALLSTLLVVFLLGLIFNASGSLSKHISYLLSGVFIAVASQLGDFFESALKRVLNIKDSSNILPGHGGLLDRIDSLLFTLPMAFFCFNVLPFVVEKVQSWFA
ncbi:phosphatidate cytidylyltransferase [Desulfovibrio litoralis]|uniref:Phosphatidate cytidylyltransferase n=1 Tax=Desulfovibrio litoralis DSM 11393 TaxID=1121455 RepID=A0A1M7SH54_9BACT|nr:phosphatidate cytidylyltransferase [Desulfovibrio litoralis]SHN57819.1 phosphatidate cytidylyltransferase [Desulfovibrio litoralis DSM 11393]